MQIFRVPKTALTLRGAAADFLKAYTTNLPQASRSAFLDTRGRIVAVCAQKLLAASEALIVIETAVRDRLLEHLQRYLTFSDVALHEESYRIWHDTDDSTVSSPGDVYLASEPGRLVLTRRDLPSGSEADYRLFRVRHRLPVQGVDFDQEMLLNVFAEGYVSYEKGCYLGQEVIARVHHRGRPPKRLIVKRVSECAPDEAARLTSRVLDPSTGEEAGFLFVDNPVPESP